MSQWQSGLFDFGGGNCLYSCCCPHCAMASARSRFDQSNCLFNFCCLTPALAGNIIREGYGIEGDCCTDILISSFCYPCTANRLLNEVGSRGPVKKGMY